MLKLPSTVRVFLATAPCDMRKQFDGLATLVRQGVRHEAGTLLGIDDFSHAIWQANWLSHPSRHNSLMTLHSE